MSWPEAFAEDYETWSASLTADIAFYVELARQATGPLVELAVGTGRVAIPIARETGRRVLGIDSSPATLAQARIRAAQAGADLELRAGDMRDLNLDEPAALIYCPARALLHLPTRADRRRTFEGVTAALAPGGRFAWNAFAFAHHLAARLDGQHQDAPVPHTNRYSVGDNRIDITRDDGATSHPVVGHEERIARTPRRRRSPSASPSRRVRRRTVHRRQPRVRVHRPPTVKRPNPVATARTLPPRGGLPRASSASRGGMNSLRARHLGAGPPDLRTGRGQKEVICRIPRASHLHKGQPELGCGGEQVHRPRTDLVIDPEKKAGDRHGLEKGDKV